MTTTLRKRLDLLEGATSNPTEDVVGRWIAQSLGVPYDPEQFRRLNRATADAPALTTDEFIRRAVRGDNGE